MVITFNSEVRFMHIIYRDARNWTTEALEIFKWSLLLTRRSDSGASHIQTLEIEQRKFSRYSNGYNFSLGGSIQEYNISRRSKLRNGSSREIQLVITFHSEVQFRHNISRRPKLNNRSSSENQMVVTFNSEVRFRLIIYRDALYWTTEALEKFKWSLLLTRWSDLGV